MRLGKWFVFFVLFVLTVASGAWAQPVSDSDFMYFVPATINVPDIPAADSFFKWAVWIDNSTVLGAVSMPVEYPSAGNVINIDTTVVTGSEKGVTFGAAGRNSAWVIKTAFTDPNIPGILCGFVSFSSFPPTNDTLVYLHFKITGGSPMTTVTVDSGEVNSQHLSITDVLAQDQLPTWTPGVLNLGPVGVGDGPGTGITPLVYGLDQNLPNPFNAQTRISFGMPAAGHVKLTVYNVLGQEVVTLLDQKLDAAKHEVVWDGFNAQGTIVASGTYFYRLKIGDAFEETRQMTLLK